MPPNLDSFSTRDLQFIVKFHAEFSGDQFRHLVHALCPSIYGQELVKVLPLSDFKKMGQCSAHMHALLVVKERYFVSGHVAPACHAIYELGHRGQPWTRPGLSLHRCLVDLVPSYIAGSPGHKSPEELMCFQGYGRNAVSAMQAGLVLALLGGVRKNVGAVDAVPIRGDIHVLMCGDPGLGKSQLLQVCASNHHCSITGPFMACHVLHSSNLHAEW